jgi:hypothetical protein
LAPAGDNADEFPSAKPTNEPARLWVQPYGAKPRNSDQLVRLGRRYLVYQLPRVARAGGRSALCWPGDRSGGHGRRLRASPGAAGHPPRQDGPPVAARSRPEPHPGRLPGWRAGQDHPRERRRRPRRHRIRSAFPAPGADPPARQRRTTNNAAQPRVRNAARAASSKAVSGNGSSSRIRSSRATVGLRSPSIRGRAIWALTGVTRCSQ